MSEKIYTIIRSVSEFKEKTIYAPASEFGSTPCLDMVLDDDNRTMVINSGHTVKILLMFNDKNKQKTVEFLVDFFAATGSKLNLILQDDNFVLNGRLLKTDGYTDIDY